MSLIFSHSLPQQLAEILEPFVTAKREMKKVALERLQVKEDNSGDVLC